MAANILQSRMLTLKAYTVIARLLKAYTINLLYLAITDATHCSFDSMVLPNWLIWRVILQTLMFLHMKFEATSPRIPLLTVLTTKRSLTQMCLLMGDKVTLSNKLLWAEVAAEGPNTCVSSHVCLKISCFAKLLQAILVGTNQDFSLVWDTWDLLNAFYTRTIGLNLR